MRYLLALAALSALPAFGQSDIWKFSRTATLSATSAAFTVSLPAAGVNEVEILDFTLQCTADCAVTTERNGSAPTATLGTWRAENLDTAPRDVGNAVVQPTVRIHFNSDSTGGAVADESFVFPANAIVPWSTGQVIMTGAGTTTNYTIRIGPMTGTYRFQLRARIRR